MIRNKLPALQQAASKDGAIPEVVRQISEIVEEQCQRQLDLAPHIREMMGLD